MNSSRTPIIDVVENIAECIALQSHLGELYSSTINEMEENLKDMDENMKDEYIKEMRETLDELKVKYEDTYQKRRKLMNVLKDSSENCNMDYWCMVKHSIASRQFSKELWDTDRNNVEYEMLYIKSSEVMYQILSKFLGIKEIVKCGRCLLDQMEN